MRSVQHRCRQCERRITIPARLGKYTCKCGNVIEVLHKLDLDDLVTSIPNAPEILPISVGQATVEKRILEHAKTVNPAYVDETVDMQPEDWVKLLEQHDG